MEALRSPEGWYFGEKYAIVYSPGARVEQTLKELTPLRAEEKMAILDASAPSGSGYLPGHDVATEAAARLHAKHTTIHASEATLARVKQELHDSAAMMFFGHGRPDGSGMALEIAPGVLLRAQDLSPGLLPEMRLAVLAACSSGSADHGLQDSRSLVRSLIAAGVPTVIASHWNVDSQSTGAFMQSFYSHLAKEPAATALQNARVEMRAINPHPYFWGAFSLSGKAN
jgi:CHAT domain-containing protein